MNSMNIDERFNDEFKHWEFSFDINQELLRNVYGKANKTYAYHEIQKYMFSHGFSDDTQKQGSCYFSSKPMTFMEVDTIIRNMFHELPWLSECISKDALYERPMEYCYEAYRTELNYTENHKKELEHYYKKLGMKIPLDIKTELESRKNIPNNNFERKEIKYTR